MDFVGVVINGERIWDTFGIDIFEKVRRLSVKSIEEFGILNIKTFQKICHRTRDWATTILNRISPNTGVGFNYLRSGGL